MHAVEGPKTKEAIWGSTTPLDEKEKMQKMLEKIMKKRGGRNGKKKTQTGRKGKKRKKTSFSVPRRFK